MPLTLFPPITPSAPGTPVSKWTDSFPEARDTLRVLHVVNGEHFSGAERVQSHLGRCLPECGVSADFACVKPGRFAQMLADRFHDATAAPWGRAIAVPMRGRLDVTAAVRLARCVRDGRYQLLHAHTPRTAMLASLASRWTGVPWVYHVHSPAARDCEKAWSNRINAVVENWSLTRCSRLITVSQSLKDDLLARGVHPDRVNVVHNGVPAIRPPRPTRPIVGGAWTLGMIALMRPRKGLEIAIDAISRLARDGHDVTLRCIGPFETLEYQAFIHSKIDRLLIGHRIEWVGFTDDVPLELSRMDAMVLPSLFGEGLPMVVLEAMAAGTPTIATRVEGTPEAIRHAIEGLLAEPRDSESLAEQIAALITGKHDWQSLSDAAMKRHRDRFSDQGMASATADVYRQVLTSRNP